jgi:hypothetical protein
MLDHHALAALSLIGVLLDSMGGLYLAHDLLGGRQGPLRTLTRTVTDAVLFGLGYGLPLGPIYGLVAGIGLGVGSGSSSGRRAAAAVPSRGAPRWGSRSCAAPPPRALRPRPPSMCTSASVWALSVGGLVAAYLIGCAPWQ